MLKKLLAAAICILVPCGILLAGLLLALDRRGLFEDDEPERRAAAAREVC